MLVNFRYLIANIITIILINLCSCNKKYKHFHPYLDKFGFNIIKIINHWMRSMIMLVMVKVFVIWFFTKWSTTTTTSIDCLLYIIECVWQSHPFIFCPYVSLSMYECMIPIQPNKDKLIMFEEVLPQSQRNVLYTILNQYTQKNEWFI